MEPFKNAFSFSKVKSVAVALKRAYPDFSTSRFSIGLESALESLELKQRMHLVADRIEAGLPCHPPELFSILVKTLSGDGDGPEGLRGFLVWPLTEIVARRGMDHFSESMEALAEMTSRFTAEFAIRPFIREQPLETFRQLHGWCGHPDPHVRRLVSEGSRPLLPWGGNLPELFEPPFPTLGLLEKLQRDPSDYVRLSVSNHLNDFSKRHPEKVVGILRRWRDANPGDKHLERISRHACRTLLKAGHPGALDLFGYGSADMLELRFSTISPPAVELGGHLRFNLSIRNLSHEPLRVMFDYAIHHLKANGTHSAKVFKGRSKEILPGELWLVSGQHLLKPVTTRVYQAGLHYFEPLLNGRAFGRMEFELNL